MYVLVVFSPDDIVPSGAPRHAEAEDSSRTDDNARIATDSV
jgi:hypothetical protein